MTKTHLDRKALHKGPLLAIEQLHTQIASSLILAPHPDDEALGCGGMIAYLRQQQVNVWVCFMTSGGASHPKSKKYPEKKLMQLREKEALEACKILGVDGSKVIFLRQPDSQLSALSLKIVEDVVVEIIDLIENNLIASIFLPWRRDVHLDHMATYAIGIKAIKRVVKNIQVIEYPVWMWHNLLPEHWPVQGEMEVFRLDVEAVFEIKKASILAHQSQTTHLIADDPEGFILTANLLKPFLKSFEYFFIDPHQKPNSLAKSYFDNLYAAHPDPWNFTHSPYEKEKYDKIDSFLEGTSYINGLELGCSIGIQTRLLASHCQNLLAVDVSEDAINTARENNKDLENIDFEQRDLITDFPLGNFDFISLCEVGYYFNKEDLNTVFQHVAEALLDNGHFLLVHWTSYVRDFPLTGNQVHEYFREFNETRQQFALHTIFVHEQYELMLWEKVRQTV